MKPVRYTQIRKLVDDVDRGIGRIPSWVEYNQIIRELLSEIHVAPIQPQLLKSQVERLVREGQYIPAIKLHRELTGESLMEAKAFVDRIRATMDPKSRERMFQRKAATINANAAIKVRKKPRLRDRPAPKGKKKRRSQVA